MIKNINLRLALFIILSIANLLTSGQAIIQMQSDAGVYYIPCKVNGLKLKFIFDTGASNVSISLSEAKYMLENGYLDNKDLGASEYYEIANGDVKEGTIVNLKVIEVGGIKLYNVKATIIHSTTAPLLLGQSALEKFGKFSFDYSSGTLTLGAGNNKVSFQSAYTNDTTKMNIVGKEFNFPIPAGYVDYNKLDSSYAKSIALLSDTNINPVLYFVTSSNLMKMIASDSVSSSYFMLYYTKDILSPCGNELFLELADALCKVNYQKLSKEMIGRVDSTLKDYYNNEYLNLDIKLKDLNYCQIRGNSWAYKISTVKESVATKTNRIKSSTVNAFGYIKINNRLFNFLYSNDLDEQTTLEAYINELEKILNRITASNPFDSKDYFDLAMGSYNNLKYTDALSYLNESIKQNNKYADSYYIRAAVKAFLGDTTGAIHDFDKYIDFKPDFAEAYYNRGLLQVKIGQIKKGVVDFSKAIDLNPRESTYYGLRGTAKILSGDRNGACLDFDRAITLGSKEAIELKKHFVIIVRT